MNKITKVIIGLLILGLGVQLSLTQDQAPLKPDWIKDVNWQDKPRDSARIEELLWTKISPYMTEYESVNISPTGKGDSLRVVATARDSDNPDIYDFAYANNELQLTGYLLAAIPQMYRNEAIGIALEDKEVAGSVASLGSPAVRRILPETSEKFYAPKTMLSVTWKGVSALVDIDDRKVAKVWKTGTQTIRSSGN